MRAKKVRAMTKIRCNGGGKGTADGYTGPLGLLRATRDRALTDIGLLNYKTGNPIDPSCPNFTTAWSWIFTCHAETEPLEPWSFEWICEQLGNPAVRDQIRREAMRLWPEITYTKRRTRIKRLGRLN